jgi:hypothetical protein
MEDRHWQAFFTTAVEVLGSGDLLPGKTPSWCSWTTFTRLAIDAGYWTHGLPRREDILETYIADGGIWGQPFSYADLAHIIVPREFYWESKIGPGWECGSRLQDIEALSKRLNANDVTHRLTDRLLEIKLY